MTREEAIMVLEFMATNWVGMALDAKGPMLEVIRKRVEAIDTAQDALRPAARKKVENIWRGEWVEDDDGDGRHCSRCGADYCYTEIMEERDGFCSSCGAANTDKAMDILMERLEALRDEKETG